MECPQCGQEISDNLQRCFYCGAPVSAPAPVDQSEVEATIRELMLQGNKLQAIKLYRTHTGADLAEAIAAVESLARESHSSLDCIEAASELESPPEEDELQQAVLKLLRRGEKLEAIKLVRQRTQCDLKEAKDFMDAVAVQHGIEDPSRAGCLGMLLLVAASLWCLLQR